MMHRQNVTDKRYNLKNIETQLGRLGSEQSMISRRGPFLESPGNLPVPISVFGDKMFLNRSHFLSALNTKF